MACNINTMFNARNYYKSARNRPLNANGKPNNQAIDEYTKTIKKCGIIISERKKGAQMDDAVFLMAKALYYKGNSAFQAKDQFENLILGFPKSPFVAESHIFVAKVLREINQPKEAERRLDEFVRNPRFRKDHPQALLLMTDFAIQDKDYIKAQYWLERIIRDYPKTKEFRTAYFLFGKNYYEQKDYTASLAAFEKMQGSKRIDKVLKLDTAYYIGLNQLELGKLEQAYRTTSSLLRNEARPDKLPAIRLLKARILFAQGKNSEATKEIEDINKTYPRTESSAAAYYYLAEYQYYKAGDRAAAVTNYTRVRSEFTASILGEKSQLKSTAVTNTLPRANLNSETGLKAFLDYHYQAAESFLSFLALPDSAIARYRKIIKERDVHIPKRDSLQVKLSGVSATLDSLRIASLVPKPPTARDEQLTREETVFTDTLDVNADSLYVQPTELPVLADSLIVQADSLFIPPSELPVFADTLVVVIDSLLVPPTELQVMADTPVAVLDSLYTPPIELPVMSDTLIALTDSLFVSPTELPILPDTLAVAADSTQYAVPDLPEEVVTIAEEKPKPVSEPNEPKIDPAIARQITQQEQQLERLRSQIKALDDLITQFDNEIIPFCLFAIGSVLHDNYPDSEENAETLAYMQANYSNNKFTKALQSLQQGLPVRLIDPFEESQEARLDELFGLIVTQPDSALAGLEEMRQSVYSRLKLAANFRLGWYYSFDALDTTAAKSYLKAVLDDTNAGDYAVLTRRFYDGRHFLVWNEAPIDSLVLADSLFVADSLGTVEDLPAEPDTLQSQSHEAQPEAVPEPSPEVENLETPSPEPSPIIKEEDTPLE
jgi:TolA-binding protein